MATVKARFAYKHLNWGLHWNWNMIEFVTKQFY